MYDFVRIKAHRIKKSHWQLLLVDLWREFHWSVMKFNRECSIEIQFGLNRIVSCSHPYEYFIDSVRFCFTWENIYIRTCYIYTVVDVSRIRGEQLAVSNRWKKRHCSPGPVQPFRCRWHAKKVFVPGCTICVHSCIRLFPLRTRTNYETVVKSPERACFPSFRLPSPLVALYHVNAEFHSLSKQFFHLQACCFRHENARVNARIRDSFWRTRLHFALVLSTFSYSLTILEISF